MKQIQIWPNHVRVADLDLVLPRSNGEPISRTLNNLARMGLNTHPENVEIHGVVQPTESGR
jgi:hypothetical protein